MRDFRITAERLPKGRAYPVQRCSLEAAFEVADVRTVYLVRFHHWKGRPLLEALFQGTGRSASWAGLCEMNINSIPAREVDQVQPLVLGEGIVAFLAWLRQAEQLALSVPKDLSRWEAQLEDGKLSYHVSYAHA